jgi:hypothetical protein
MIYLKGTFEKCLGYDQHVTASEGYSGATQRWAEPIQRGDDYYIAKHESYPPTTGLVEAELPLLPDSEE